MQTLDSYFIETSVMLTPFDTKKIQTSVLEIRNKYGSLQDVLKPKKKFGFKGDKKKKKLIAKEEEELKPNINPCNKKSQDEFGFTVKNRCNEVIDLNHQDIHG